MLDKIIKEQEDELLKLKAGIDFERIEGEMKAGIAGLNPTRDFFGALDSDPKKPDAIRIVAEVKKASPSKGVIRADFDPVSIAAIYEANGAAAISVLTDEKHFQGSIEYLKQIKEAVSLPILRKDFIIDEHQVYESRAFGADAILLIAAVLSSERLRALLNLCAMLNLGALVEVHNEKEVKTALSAGAKLIGINNRDLRTFKTDLKTTIELAPKASNGVVVVAESGIHTCEDIARLKTAGAKAFLIGEALMKEPDIGAKLRELIEC